MLSHELLQQLLAILPLRAVTIATANHLPSQADTKDDSKQPMTTGQRAKLQGQTQTLGYFARFCPLSFLSVFTFEQRRCGSCTCAANSRCLIIWNSSSSFNEAFVRLFDCGETFEM